MLEDLRKNAKFIPTLAKMASEDPQTFPRQMVPQGNLPDGTPRPWAAYPGPTKSAAASVR